LHILKLFHTFGATKRKKKMKTINVQISDTEYDAFGFSKDKLSFSEVVDLVERRISLQALKRSVKLSEQYHLASMTMDEISEEVCAVRTKKTYLS
jgi:hypothetical protein